MDVYSTSDAPRLLHSESACHIVPHKCPQLTQFDVSMLWILSRRKSYNGEDQVLIDAKCRGILSFLFGFMLIIVTIIQWFSWVFGLLCCRSECSPFPYLLHWSNIYFHLVHCPSWQFITSQFSLSCLVHPSCLFVSFYIFCSLISNIYSFFPLFFSLFTHTLNYTICYHWLSNLLLHISCTMFFFYLSE